ncbi:hypothetical protein ACOME3_009870 [Neoechinorhynchus agilis]
MPEREADSSIEVTQRAIRTDHNFGRAGRSVVNCDDVDLVVIEVVRSILRLASGQGANNSVVFSRSSSIAEVKSVDGRSAFRSLVAKSNSGDLAPKVIAFEDASFFIEEIPKDHEDLGGDEGIANRVKNRSRAVKRVIPWQPVVPQRTNASKRPRWGDNREMGSNQYKIIRSTSHMTKPQDYTMHRRCVGLKMDMSRSLRRAVGTIYKYFCNKCTFETNTAEALTEHLWNVHVFRCLSCTFMSDTRYGLLQHQMSHCPVRSSTRVPPIILDTVIESSDHRMYLLNNFEPVSAYPSITTQIYACQHCAFVSVSEDEMSKHCSQLSTFKFGCSKCHHSSGSRKGQIEHRNKYHRTKLSPRKGRLSEQSIINDDGDEQSWCHKTIMIRQQVSGDASFPLTERLGFYSSRALLSKNKTQLVQCTLHGSSRQNSGNFIQHELRHIGESFPQASINPSFTQLMVRSVPIRNVQPSVPYCNTATTTDRIERVQNQVKNDVRWQQSSRRQRYFLFN